MRWGCSRRASTTAAGPLSDAPEIRSSYWTSAEKNCSSWVVSPSLFRAAYRCASACRELGTSDLPAIDVLATGISLFISRKARASAWSRPESFLRCVSHGSHILIGVGRHGVSERRLGHMCDAVEHEMIGARHAERRVERRDAVALQLTHVFETLANVVGHARKRGSIAFGASRCDGEAIDTFGHGAPVRVRLRNVADGRPSLHFVRGAQRDERIHQPRAAKGPAKRLGQS
eukprot:3479823-Prymnesium_polylepis.2